MNGQLFSLGSADFLKGAALAIIVAVLGAIEQGLTAHGFAFAEYDWASITNIAIVAFVGYLSKNYLSDQNGKILGKVG